jgi:hypothetical protein
LGTKEVGDDARLRFFLFFLEKIFVSNKTYVKRLLLVEAAEATDEDGVKT